MLYSNSLIYVRRGWREVRYYIADYAENFQKLPKQPKYFNIYNTFFFQHNQQYDTLSPPPPCTRKLKAGIAYYYRFDFGVWTWNAQKQ
jgi:hypothetical protein